MPRAAVKGKGRPRIAPPVPAWTLAGKAAYAEFMQAAEDLGIELMDWQRYAARYLYARGPDGKWLYPEFAALVARQNGKTTLLLPHILTRIRNGRRVLHTAQNREIPRETFELLAGHLDGSARDPEARHPLGERAGGHQARQRRPVHAGRRRSTASAVTTPTTSSRTRSASSGTSRCVPR